MHTFFHVMNALLKQDLNNCTVLSYGYIVLHLANLLLSMFPFVSFGPKYCCNQWPSWHTRDSFLRINYWECICRSEAMFILRLWRQEAKLPSQLCNLWLVCDDAKLFSELKKSAFWTVPFNRLSSKTSCQGYSKFSADEFLLASANTAWSVVAI